MKYGQAIAAADAVVGIFGVLVVCVDDASVDGVIYQNTWSTDLGRPGCDDHGRNRCGSSRRGCGSPGGYRALAVV